LVRAILKIVQKYNSQKFLVHSFRRCI